MPHSSASRLQALFSATLDLPEADRESFMELHCQNDPAMLSELRALVEMDKDLANKTVRPIAPELSKMLSASAPAESMVGLRVGAFELREELGRGGMGSVYRGERVDGSVSQQAAIKFVRRELLDANTLRRFQIERQTLAALDHPNIARLLDAGELDDGTPYFVMEYVAGVPITDYCAQAKLGMRERVQLFRPVCAAVMQAHRSLVVHRDLKPSNILVNADGVPKLLDFGIAKPLNADFNNAAEEQTGTAQRYFSPSYSAPEQLLGGAIGVGCDVYALGLLLYELLAGTRPFDFTGLTAGQIERLVTTVPPDAPSIAVSKTEATQALRRQLRGDLDGIVLRCLRKAANERYASVEQLDADLGNYLEGRPVLARGGHGWYRARKFISRNRLAVAVGAVVLVTSALGVAAIARQSQIAKQQATIAEQRAAELQQVSEFQADMLAQVNPAQAGILLTEDIMEKLDTALRKTAIDEQDRAAQIAAFSAHWKQVNATDAARTLIDRTILEPADSAIRAQFQGQPLVDAALSQVLAGLYRTWGLLDDALPLQERALSIRRRVLGNDHVETMASIASTAALLSMQGRNNEAEPFWQEVLSRNRRILGEEHQETLKSINNMGFLRFGQGRLDEAESYYREALEGRTRVLGEDHAETLNSLGNVAAVLKARGRLSEAEIYYRKALQKRRLVLGENDQSTLGTISNLGLLLQEQSRWEEAERYIREALEKRRLLLGEEHPFTITSIHNLGALLLAQGQLSQAEPYLREALNDRLRFVGAQHPATLQSANFLGALQVAQGRPRDAIALLGRYEEAIRKAHLDSGTNNLCMFLTVTGAAHTALGALDVAESNLIEAGDICLKSSDATLALKRDYIRAMVDLSSRWQLAAPAIGKNAHSSTEWKNALEALEAENATRIAHGVNRQAR